MVLLKKLVTKRFWQRSVGRMHLEYFTPCNMLCKYDTIALFTMSFYGLSADGPVTDFTVLFMYN